MAMGFDTLDLRDKQYDHLRDHFGGHIGMVMNLVKFAAHSEKWLETHAIEEFPGVLDYEVSSPFGEWYASKLADEYDFPDDKAIAELERRLEEFFK
jgi:hypothetical protein